jgi:hypothetical protein
MRLQNAVVENAPVKGGEYLLLLILSRYASDDGGRLFPSISTLAKETRQHKRNVQRQLRSLEAKGLLVRLGSKSYLSTVNYRIVVEKLCTGGGVPPPGGVAYRRKGGGNIDKRGGVPPPDSLLDSLSIHQNRLEKSKTVKTPAGDAALRSMKDLLRQP